MEIDPHVIDVLLPDLVGHDRHPSAYLTYLYLYRQTADEAAELSLTQIAEGTGLSKRAVQAALATLQRRGLVDIERDSITSVGRYAVKRPWQSSR
ncbi:MarR family transcriptional regulator [Candidatus Palauibacter polyketidifaciens]|uniref:MarR family transcriptional regulator n=1 Tax=Candidatus Palauibacter polyketidifaciens TaxID=3056740 RepID=UPI0023A3AD66|nr:MarR family transcriptional regulator [Candidatus Palauibacter polyketidifaciens]MDE2720147.1 MarR family transcriptional regulator [Candidatus Palauibacter polyketidifaciens]